MRTASQRDRSAPRWRRRLALLCLVGGVAWTLSHALAASPVDARLVYRLGPAHAATTRVDVHYEVDGEAVAAVAFRHPEGAPETLRHEVRLPAGATRIVARTSSDGQRPARRFERALHLPTEGDVYVDLFDRAAIGRLP